MKLYKDKETGETVLDFEGQEVKVVKPISHFGLIFNDGIKATLVIKNGKFTSVENKEQ